MDHCAYPRLLYCILGLALLVAPPALASHDGDPIPDPVEPVVCGFPAIAGALSVLPPFAGRCIVGDYSGPMVTSAPCSGCSQAIALAMTDVPLTPAGDVGAVPLLPIGIPSLGPFSTPPAEQPIGTIVARKQVGDAERYCVTVTPQASAPLSQCVDLGPLGPLMIDIGPVPLVSVGSQSVGPTPGLAEGSLGRTPPLHVGATTMDLIVGTRWVESLLNQRLGPGLVNVWEPVDLDDPSAVQWWIDNGHTTTLDATLVLKLDGAVQQVVEVHVPYVGQFATAIERTTQ